MHQIVMLDQRIIAMIQEVRNHPKLFERIQQAQAEGEKAHETIFHLQQDDNIPVIQSFEQGIGFLAAEVGILLDGTYSYEAICNLCDEIRIRLIDKRAAIANNCTFTPGPVATGIIIH